MPDRLPILIAGGGIAGLVAATTLHRAEIPFVLLEAGPRWGGVIRTESTDGFLLEAGPDAILAQKPEGLALCRELGLGDRLIPTNPQQRTVFIVRGGRAHAMPDGLVLTIPTRVLPFARSSLFTWAGKLRMALEIAIPPGQVEDESIASFMKRRFGREALDLLGEPLLAGIHSGDASRLSMRATFPRFLDMERRSGSLIRAMLAAPRVRSAGGGHAFYSLEGGLSELIDALVGRLPLPSLRLGCEVRRAGRNAAGGYRVALSTGEELEGSALIVAVPAHRAGPLVRDLDGDVAATLDAIPFASTAVVFLGYRREDVAHPLNGYGLMASRSEGWRTTAMSFFSTKYPGRAPEGQVLLRGFLGGARDPSILDLTDEALVDQVRQDAGALLGLRGAPVLTRVYRWPLGTPQMEVGHLVAMDHLAQRVARQPGLFLTGAGLRTTGIPDGVADAARVARDAASFWRESA